MYPLHPPLPDRSSAICAPPPPLPPHPPAHPPAPAPAPAPPLFLADSVPLPRPAHLRPHHCRSRPPWDIHLATRPPLDHASSSHASLSASSSSHCCPEATRMMTPQTPARSHCLSMPLSAPTVTGCAAGPAWLPQAPRLERQVQLQHAQPAAPHGNLDKTNPLPARPASLNNRSDTQHCNGLRGRRRGAAQPHPLMNGTSGKYLPPIARPLPLPQRRQPQQRPRPRWPHRQTDIFGHAPQLLRRAITVHCYRRLRTEQNAACTEGRNSHVRPMW
mmetsp:Transcript_71048/g.179303  ORF Transcript_71048/g.179303 Transcript_71048/m.179303 type:complete len:274 (-) Transcript_71048:382-1203(-)